MMTGYRTKILRPQAPAAAPTWRGWIKRYHGERWQEVCAGASYGECYGALLAHDDGLHSDRLVLRADDDPNLR